MSRAIKRKLVEALPTSYSVRRSRRMRLGNGMVFRKAPWRNQFAEPELMRQDNAPLSTAPEPALPAFIFIIRRLA